MATPGLGSPRFPTVCWKLATRTTPVQNSTGDVTVNSGGMLAGQGTVIGNLNATASGFIRPGAMNGTTPGTLTVSGNATFEGGSVFVVGANAAGQASKLAVEGTATLNNDARVQVTAQNGTYAPSTQYTILTCWRFGRHHIRRRAYQFRLSHALAEL